MILLNRVKHVLRMCGHALNSTVHDRLSAIERDIQASKAELQAAKLMETDAALLQASIHIIENLHALTGRVIVYPGADADASCTTPEGALVEFLYSHVPARAAVEIDGHNRELSAGLVRAGYEVYSLEADRSGGQMVVSRMNGASSGVAVSGLDTIPAAIGIVMLGSAPLAVAREWGNRRASVITADLSANLEELVPEMRSHEYYWHLMVYRNPERAGTSYLANYPHALPDAHGTAFFFRDYKAFAEAQAWCAATLSRTYVKPPQA